MVNAITRTVKSMKNVKRISGTAALSFLLLGTSLLAQQGTQKGSNSTEAFNADGIKVIMTPADNELVSIIVGLEGGIAGGETANPALGDFMVDLATSSGSESVSKNDLRRFLSRTSTRLGGSSDLVGVRYTMTSTRSRFDEAWKVLSSIIRKPSYDETEYRNILQRRVAQAQNSWSNPENYAARMSDSLVKITHPYLGRYTYQEDVEQVTIPLMREFHKKLSERSRMIVVVVGNVTRDEIERKLADFASWPVGSYTAPMIPAIRLAPSPGMAVVDMPDKPTTYIFAGFAGPSWTDKDSWPLAVGMSYLREKLFEEIRTKRNLSYAPFAYTGGSHGYSVGTIGVSTIWPDSSITIMLREMQKMKDGEFSADDLEKTKQVYITNYYFREMTNAGKANSLYYNERYAGDWRRAFSYDAIQSVDKESVQRAFRKYAKNLQVGIVGKQSAVTPVRFQYANSLPVY